MCAEFSHVYHLLELWLLCVDELVGCSDEPRHSWGVFEGSWGADADRTFIQIVLRLQCGRLHPPVVCAHSRVEACTGLTHNKPVIAVWEADKNKGGASLEELRQEGRAHLNKMTERFPGLGGAEEMLNRIIDIEGKPPIRWVRRIVLPLPLSHSCR